MYRAIVVSVSRCRRTGGLAQTTGAATILGNVTDTSGAVVPGAKVTVINTETNFHFEGNQPGGILLCPVSPARYLQRDNRGRQFSSVRDRIELRTNDQPRIDVSLEVGTRAESVEVRERPGAGDGDVGGRRCAGATSWCRSRCSETHVSPPALPAGHSGDQRASPQRPAQAWAGLQPDGLAPNCLWARAQPIEWSRRASTPSRKSKPTPPACRRNSTHSGGRWRRSSAARTSFMGA